MASTNIEKALIAAALVWACTATAGAQDLSGASDDVRVFGVQAGIASSTPGAFLPAGTKLACYSIQEGRCWDGKRWHSLYPGGERHYQHSSIAVECLIIVSPESDCWTGSAWFKLPQGQVFGVQEGIAMSKPGAFKTMPLDPPR